MKRSLIYCVWMIFVCVIAITGMDYAYADDVASSQSKRDEKQLVYVVPIEGIISEPLHFIIRRALKQADEHKVKTVVFRMDTPGGEMDAILNIMKTLERYEGHTIAYVDVEALSAGAFVASSMNDIYMAPKGLIGSAGVIQATGEDLPETWRLKVESYLKTRLRLISPEHRYRADVIRAMTDKDYVLQIGDKVIKEKGELLTLTADEAVKRYGEPPQPLLANATEISVNGLLDQVLGKDNYRIEEFPVTWSERLAKWLNSIASILSGLGFLLLFIEFKKSTFGLIGVVGLMCFGIVFATNYIAGLAGNEMWLIFIVVGVLFGLEVYLFPGTLLFGVLSIVVVFGILVWSLADIWPGQTVGDMSTLLVHATASAVWSLFGALVGLWVVFKILERTPLWQSIVLNVEATKMDPRITRGADPHFGDLALPAMGVEGEVIVDLHPEGQIEINGKPYLATVLLGSVKRGEQVRVIDYADFALIVEPINHKK
jgi:membrane-bound serine protease (ClpP class)